MAGFLELAGTAVGRSPDGGSIGTQPPLRGEAVDEEAGRDTKELRPLVDNKPSPASRDGDHGLVQRFMLSIDEHANVKVLLRVWRPRLELVVRLLLVATFLDDALRMTMHFSEHVEQVSEVSRLPAPVATVLLAGGLLAQSLGSFAMLALFQVEIGTTALISWATLQPLLYSQLSNFEFMSESLSLIGGLLMLRAHLLSKTPTAQLLGRLLLPTAYIYQAGRFFLSAFTLDETTSLGTYLSSLSMFAVNCAFLVALVVASMLVATGLKSRVVAVALSLANMGFVFYQHPFFRFLVREDGHWGVDADNIWMPNVMTPKDVTVGDFDAWQIYDLHRYYFFLGLSTSGALLLLAQFGPGDISMQKDEVLLPEVSRAKD